jgi:hypothetical protein
LNTKQGKKSEEVPTSDPKEQRFKYSALKISNLQPYPYHEEEHE